MAKAGELDWGHLLKTGHVGDSPEEKMLKEGLSVKIEDKDDVKDSNKGGEKITKAQLIAEALDIVRKTPRQPTDEQLFGGCVPSEEQVKAAEDRWNNVFKKHFTEGKAPIDKKNKTLDESWKSGTSFMDSLTPEEREEYEKRLNKSMYQSITNPNSQE